MEKRGDRLTSHTRVLICTAEANKERETCDERVIEESDRRVCEKRERATESERGETRMRMGTDENEDTTEDVCDEIEGGMRADNRYM